MKCRHQPSKNVGMLSEPARGDGETLLKKKLTLGFSTPHPPVTRETLAKSPASSMAFISEALLVENVTEYLGCLFSQFCKAIHEV